MKSLDTIIRLKKWQLNDKQRKLADLRRMRDDLEQRTRTLEAEIESEAGVTGEQATGAMVYGVYAQAALDRRDRLRNSIAEVDTEITACAEELAEAFEEVKKHEISRDARHRRARVLANRRQQATMDEMAQDLMRQGGGYGSPALAGAE